MCSINRILIACLLIVASKAQNKPNKELFGFPEVEDDETSKNKEVITRSLLQLILYSQNFFLLVL